MTRFIVPHPATALLLGVAMLLCAEPSARAAAQTSMQQQEMSALSAAIEGARRSPFHARAAGAYARSALAVPPVRVALSPAWLADTDFAGFGPRVQARGGVQAPAEESILSKSKLFLATTGAAAVADLIGLYMLHAAEAGDDEFNLIGAVVISALGPAGGATLAGAHFRPALVGSVVGVGAAVLAAVVAPTAAFGFTPFFAIPVLVHSGVTTLLTIRQGGSAR